MIRRLSLSVVLALALSVLVAVVASAHVEVSPGEVAKGATDVTLRFRVPNESDTAKTVKVEVRFPADHPLVGVLVEPVAGWTSTVQRTKLAHPITTDDGTVTEAVSQVTWSGGEIPPGDFQELSVLVGRVPSDTDRLTFPTLQTYSDGTVTSWIEPTIEGAPEPEHPAPTLALTGTAPTTTGSGTAPNTSAPGATAGPQVTAASGSKGDSGPSSTATAALVVGVLALAFAIGGLVVGWRGRRSRP